MTRNAHGVRFTRAATLIGGGLALTLVLAGCSGTSSDSATYDPNAPVTLTLSDQTAVGNTPPIQTLVDAYEKLHPNVKITLTLSPVASYAQVIQTQLQAGNAPDVIWGTTGAGDAEGILSFAKGGYLEPLQSYDWATAIIPSNYKSLFYTDENLYGVPEDLVPVGTVYNLTALNSIGITNPPTSLPELYADCATATAAGKTLFNIAGAAGPNAGIFAMSIAASAVYGVDPQWNTERAAGSVTFADSDLWKNALGIMLDLNSKGCFQQGAAAGTIEQLFPAVAQGNAMALAATAQAASDLTSIVPGNTYKATPFPGDTEASTKLFASPSDALSVNAHSKNLQAALAFVEWTGAPAQLDSYASLTGNASMTSVTSGSAFSDQLSYLAPYLSDSSKNYPLGNLAWTNGAVYSALGTGVQGLLTGQASVDQVLQSLDAAW